MPPKRAFNATSASTGPLILNESLLATDAEKQATSKSLYGDYKARISGNVSAVHDVVRLSSFRRILPAFRGKTILHIGCGIGLLSMLAAKAHAKRVVAVEMSALVDSAAEVARRNAIQNITFLKGTVKSLYDAGKFRDVDGSSGVMSFDLIICEWMGPFLTSEGLLDELKFSKEKLLAANGLVCPDQSSLYVAGITDHQYVTETVDYWDNVYGYAMRPMKELVLEEASTCAIPLHSVLTNTCLIKSINMKDYPSNTPGPSRNFEAPFTIQSNRKSTLHYLTFYLDVSFTHPTEQAACFTIGYTIGGHNPWTEVSVCLREAIPVMPGDVISGTVKVMPSERNPKVLEIFVTAVCKGQVTTVNTSGSYVYHS